MESKETIEKVENLLKQYEDNWNKKIEIDRLPPGITQEKLVIILERIVNTGESVLVGWKKCFLDKQIRINE